MLNNIEDRVVCLIGGVDSSCGAGVTKDILTADELGFRSVVVVTALTAQNSYGVSDILNVELHHFRKTLEAVIEDDTPTLSAFKIGMLSNSEVIREVASVLSKYRREQKLPLVLDPVIYSTSGDQLIDDDAIAFLNELIKQATIVTPNYLEACRIASVGSDERLSPSELAHKLAELYNISFLVKDGHGDGKIAQDALAVPKNDRVHVTLHTHNRLHIARSIHGTGCMLSTAIATQLALSLPMELAVASSIAYLQRKLIGARKVMSGEMLYLP
jgi:hydroxymethylpyrimidine/phosphomethylpyrimidine kinase